MTREGAREGDGEAEAEGAKAKAGDGEKITKNTGKADHCAHVRARKKECASVQEWEREINK